LRSLSVSQQSCWSLIKSPRHWRSIIFAMVHAISSVRCRWRWVVVIAVVVLGVLAAKLPSYPAALAIGAVLGGAVGNLGDRIFRHDGGVVDFIHTSFWPTFNIADAAVVCGCLGLAVIFWRASAHQQPSTVPIDREAP
jgi:lipoprotein signal peptidase